MSIKYLPIYIPVYYSISTYQINMYYSPTLTWTIMNYVVQISQTLHITISFVLLSFRDPHMWQSLVPFTIKKEKNSFLC